MLFQQGCWSPESDCNSGTLFYAWPYGQNKSIGEYARLEYDVYFPSDFTWVKGGKLPGFTGAVLGCSGGADAASKGCWSGEYYFLLFFMFIRLTKTMLRACMQFD